jgi:ssDNA-binding Zn-finger/Zn-ribbon topoisomerase 1
MKQEIKDYECPYCHEHFIMTRGKFSGHIKYCDANPKSKENRENDKKRAIERHNKFIEERNKTIKEYNFKCKTCGKEYILNLSDYDFEHHNYSDYCSYSCSHSHKHTIESKKKISEAVKNSQKYKDNLNKIRSKKLDVYKLIN